MDILIFILACGLSLACALEIETNAVHIAQAPAWLKRPRVERLVGRTETALEWSTRRTEVYFYTDQATFARAHNLGPFAMAVTRAKDVTVHLGPKVTDANFDVTFAHELVHVILRQKYENAVPKWLEEGLANHLAKGPPVDYRALATAPPLGDVRDLVHPYREGSPDAIRRRYQASQALVEMIAKKCDLTNLLRLSLGKGMEGYLETYCEIKDLNSDFKSWIKKRAG